MEQKKVDYEKVEQALALLKESGVGIILSYLEGNDGETRNIINVGETPSTELLRCLMEGILICGKEKGCPEPLAGLQFMGMVATAVKKVYKEQADEE